MMHVMSYFKRIATLSDSCKWCKHNIVDDSANTRTYFKSIVSLMKILFVILANG